MKYKNSIKIIVIILIFMTSLLNSILIIIPPSEKPIDAPAEDFSAERAFDHLEIIANQPHIVGSSSNKEVREYIIETLNDIGLEETVQERAFSGVKRWGNFIVRNILFRIEGTDPGSNTIMLVAHYDTMPNSPGAMDNGSGVVTLIETARAIKAGKPLKNDVLLLFTDGEEPYLYGASAFVEDNKELIDEIAIIANFDAGGTRGPVMLTETSIGNKAMIKSLFKTTSEVTAFSSIIELSKIFPSGTDIRVLEDTGVSYMNFLVSMHKEKIHSYNDNTTEFSIGTLQQQGNYALAFCRYFGNSSNLRSEAKSGQDMIIFPASKTLLIKYSDMWVLPFAILGILLYILVIHKGVRNKALSINGIYTGVNVFLVSALAASLMSFLLIQLGRFIFRDRVNPLYLHEDFIRGSEFINIFSIGLVVLSFAILSAFFKKAMVKKSFLDLYSGVLLIICIPVIITCFIYKGLSYMFVWPLILVLFVERAIIELNDKVVGLAQHIIMSVIIILPGVVLYLPVAYISSSVGLDKMPLIILLLSIPLGLIALYIQFILPKLSRYIVMISAVSGILISLIGILGFGFFN